MKSPKSHAAYGRTQKKIQDQLKVIQNNLEAYIASIESGAKEEIDTIAKEILNRSLEICPVEFGDLKASAYNEAIMDTNSEYVVEIGYKDEKAPLVHENANRGYDYLNPTTPNTHWQFLLAPASEVENDIAQRVANNIKEKIK